MLCIHKPMDVVKGVVIDGLHTLFLGVTKLLLDLWFGDSYKACDFYIGKKVQFTLYLNFHRGYCSYMYYIIISCITVTNVL